MSAHVLLNLLNQLRKIDKIQMSTRAQTYQREINWILH